LTRERERERNEYTQLYKICRKERQEDKAS
jgi:hypothetical protein